MKRFCFAAALTAVFAAAAAAQETPSILSGSSASYLPDYSYAGYGFGVAAIPNGGGTTIDVAEFGAGADDDVDDSAAILEAVAAAHDVDGPVTVRFPAGRFIISEIVRIERSDIVLQGQGPSARGTELHFPRPLTFVGDGGALDELREYLVEYDKRQVVPSKNLDRFFSEYSWTGGFIWVGRRGARPSAYLPKFDTPSSPIAQAEAGERGGLVVRVDDGASLQAGEWVSVNWYNREGPEGPLLAEIYGETDLEIGSHHWTFHDRPLVKQRTQVIAINGDHVTLADPLLHRINAELPAEIERWAPLTNVGVEGFSITFPDSPYFGHHMEKGYNGVYVTGAANSWVCELSFTNADSGVLTYDSANLTIRDIQSLGQRPGHYAVHIGNVHNVLAERIGIFNPVLHSLTFNTRSTRSVYKDCTVHAAAVLDQHAGSNHQNLFDNVTMRIVARRGDGGSYYPVFDGSGAPYWQPGHGAFNTTWNLRVIVEGGAAPGETVDVQGLAEGPSARIVGLSGNRNFTLDYRPEPYVEWLNRAVVNVPSLYEHQRAARMNAAQR